MNKIKKTTKSTTKTINTKKLTKPKATPQVISRLMSIKTPKKSPKKSSRNSQKDTGQKLSIVKLLPAIIISFVATVLWTQPNIGVKQSQEDYTDVLAYATNTTHAGLLSATNAQRSANGVGTLTLNSTLNSAAQTKANDMVARDYWSHQTPDGLQPWVFITNTGYQYLAAGENLAYGFSNSNATVTGWMNSPSHKANLLSTNYTEVGFGMANSENFVGNGQQTVVVAMYAKPQVATPAPTPVAPVTPESTPAQVQSQSAQNSAPTTQSSNRQSTPAPTEQSVPAEGTSSEQPAESAQQEESSETPEQEINLANYSTDSNATNTEASTHVSRIQILTNGSAVWSATLVVLLICAVGLLWGLHRGYRLTQILTNSGRVIGKNLHLDLLVLSLIFLAYVLMNTSGVIK